jgi:hypothetical protein
MSSSLWSWGVAEKHIETKLESEEVVPEGEGVIDISTWFKAHGISMIHEEVIDFSVKDVYNACWMDANGYGDFLVGEGDVS